MFKLPEIDFKNNSFLEDEAIEFHYGKHHKAYVDNLNKLNIENKGMLEIINSGKGAIYNNAAQSFNHTFYWLGITPNKSNLGKDSKLMQQIKKDFNDLNSLKESFIKNAMALFGSGWTWLALEKEAKKIQIINTSNADVIDLNKFMPLMVCDVWEHAYYIDYRNSRANYLSDFWDGINWNFVEENFSNMNLERIEKLMIT